MKKMSLPKPLFAEHGARAVLLLHAYSGSPNDVRMLCRYLEQENYTVYSPMFAGHGTLNPQDILNEEVNTWFENTKTAIQFLKDKGYQEIAVLGLSMGGIMAMGALTLNDPAIVGGGAFCSPIFKTENSVPENFIRYAEKVLSYSDFSVEEQQRMMSVIKEDAVKQLAAIETFASEVQAKLANITIPVFLAQAGQDKMIAPETVYRTAQALAQTKITVQWYPNSGHVITVDQERKEFEKDVLAFIESLSWNGE
ncbi:alpha/beta hydrolase [Candidatus Enterococcus willemsii]|uniref:Carboxylesterase n=1 Tax=Candidatus Enterococcus willemsii TaxID=1857215 RepID=A0ABQ6Z1Q9_9ENTE|nr:alpha/beta fold hydrolase [Enterococcus sp. CU12B]KAF1305465.1 carboxylesterase [Enterococcus sp. CU12B]